MGEIDEGDKEVQTANCKNKSQKWKYSIQNITNNTIIC